MRLVIFDLDGTLIDSRRDLANSVNAMLEEIGRPPLPEDRIGDMVGEGARVLVRRALVESSVARGHRDYGESNEDGALGRFLAHYDKRLLEHTRAYEGVPELLEALAPSASLAVLTNKPREASERILEGLGLKQRFARIAGGDGPLPRKPDPAALIDLMRRFGATREETMLVGDSRIDLETARNAGVRVCLAAYGFGFRFDPRELTGVAIARKPREIVEHVQHIGNR